MDALNHVDTALLILLKAYYDAHRMVNCIEVTRVLGQNAVNAHHSLSVTYEPPSIVGEAVLVLLEWSACLLRQSIGRNIFHSGQH